MQPAPRNGTPGWIIALVAIGVSVVVILPIVLSLMIYGTRRYLVAAKTAEAKNSIGAIARNAQAAFERDTVDAQILTGAPLSSRPAPHALCKSAANSVPPVVPPGKKYQPSTAPNADFDAGDALTGWKCLKFSIASPIYYQYSYKAGGGYVTASIPGAPDPGSNGFEASAQGDLNANGAYSTFARGGVVDATSHLRLATQIFVNDEFE